MNVAVAAALALSASGAHSQMPMQRYPGCDLTAQRALTGDVGGAVKDPRQAHILMRANVLQADLGAARRARHLTQPTADRLYKRVEAIKAGADRYTRKQGFLSAAEVATYDRSLDAVATQVCRR